LARYYKAILVISAVLLTLSCREKLPNHYGVFVKDGDKFIELKLHKLNIISYEALKQTNPPQIKSKKPEILVYKVPINISKLSLLGPPPPPPSPLEVPCGNMLCAYNIMVSPISKKEKAYSVVPITKELQRGLYCLYSPHTTGYKVWPFIIGMSLKDNENAMEKGFTRGIYTYDDIVHPKQLNLDEVIKSIKYPEDLKKAGIEGKVILSILVGTNGTVKKVKVLESSPYDTLDKLAVKAAYKLKFKPALKNGKPISVWIRLPIIFRSP